jgi:hypothetical protein
MFCIMKASTRHMRRALVAGIAALALAGPARAEVVAVSEPVIAPVIELVMVEQPGCAWCAQWNAQIAPIYPNTPEGSLAPLRRVQLREPLPEGLTFARSAVFTPTFVLVVDGVEAGRIEGYPGEDFFWGLLGRMLDAVPVLQRERS